MLRNRQLGLFDRTKACCATLTTTTIVRICASRHIPTHAIRPQHSHPKPLRLYTRPLTTASARRPESRHTRLPVARRFGRSSSLTVRFTLPRLVRRSLLWHWRFLSVGPLNRWCMGSGGRSAKEPLQYGSAVTAERSAQRGHEAGSILGEQCGCHRDGLQWHEQHDWVLPGKTRHDQQRHGWRIERRTLQEHEGDTAYGH